MNCELMKSEVGSNFFANGKKSISWMYRIVGRLTGNRSTNSTKEKLFDRMENIH